MKKLIKYIIIAIFPVLFVLFIVLSINVFVTDWRYAHKSHMVYQDPFNWILYKSELAVQRVSSNLCPTEQNNFIDWACKYVRCPPSIPYCKQGRCFENPPNFT